MVVSDVMVGVDWVWKLCALTRHIHPVRSVLLTPQEDSSNLVVSYECHTKSHHLSIL